MKEATSEIKPFYKDQTILITGGSGFMGKVLLEKLLYSCTDLRRIYILVRPKRGKGAESRLIEMFKIPLFGRVQKERPGAQAKVTALQGDITADGLGLSPELQEQLRREVTVVFHCAATLRLEANLKDAVHMNLVGTWNVLQLAKAMPNLVTFVHLSTAFCHCDLDELDERVYPTPVDPHDIMRLVQWMDEATLNMITPRLIHPHPNTYTFTKRLAERLVYDEYPNLPVVIARPSIVIPAWREPLPGWVDSLNGPIGLMVGGGKGVIRSMLCKGEYHAEVITVDLAINALVAIAAKCAKLGDSKERPSDVPVYNITASAVKRLTWREILERGKKVVYENPFEMTIWYPDGNMRSSRLVHNLCVIFLHFLPAYFIDFLMLIFRQKRFMVRIQQRIQVGLEVLQYFTTRPWIFHSHNLMRLANSLKGTDEEEFLLDFNQIDEDVYLRNAVLGARQYCLREPLSSLPRCRRNIKILYVVDRLWSLCFYMFLLWLIYSWSGTAKVFLDSTADLLKQAPGIRTIATSRGDL